MPPQGRWQLQNSRSSLSRRGVELKRFMASMTMSKVGALYPTVFARPYPEENVWQVALPSAHDNSFKVEVLLFLLDRYSGAKSGPFSLEVYALCRILCTFRRPNSKYDTGRE